MLIWWPSSRARTTTPTVAHHYYNYSEQLSGLQAASAAEDHSGMKRTSAESIGVQPTQLPPIIIILRVATSGASSRDDPDL